MSATISITHTPPPSAQSSNWNANIYGPVEVEVTSNSFREMAALLAMHALLVRGMKPEEVGAPAFAAAEALVAARQQIAEVNQNIGAAPRF